MKIIGVIPARYKSSRFPGKPLAKIIDKPMVIWVCEQASKALGKENVHVATDDERISTVVEKYGFNFIMTSDSHLTGTDRLAEVAQKIEADIYVNIQGDEPMINPFDIQSIVKAKKDNPTYIINGMASLLETEDPHNINIPKVIVNLKNDLIYMSRSAIPGIKSTKQPNPPDYKKQICIYAFNREELLAFNAQKDKTPLESFEDIEIIRFLELGYKIKMVETEGASLAVDIPSDIQKVEKAILNGKV